MTKNQIIVGYKEGDAEQVAAVDRVIEYLEAEPIDQLIGTPESPVPDDVDYFSLANVLDEMCKKIRKNRDDIKDLDDRVKDLE